MGRLLKPMIGSWSISSCWQASFIGRKPNYLKLKLHLIWIHFYEIIVMVDCLVNEMKVLVDTGILRSHYGGLAWSQVSLALLNCEGVLFWKIVRKYELAVCFYVNFGSDRWWTCEFCCLHVCSCCACHSTGSFEHNC